MGGAVIPLRTDSHIMWTIKFRDGEVKRFKFPVRTTQVGSIKIDTGMPMGGDLDSPHMSTEIGRNLPGL
jgi:adenylylsulfate reductase subunit B